MPRSLTVQQPGPLQAFLFDSFPEVKKTRVKQWLKYDSVLVNGKVQSKHDHPLVAGDAVQVLTEAESRTQSSLPRDLKIVHEDDSIIVIDKPANLLSIATDAERKHTAYARLTDYVRKGDPRSRERVWIVHRLDRETSGLMIFARTPQAKDVLQGGWDDVEKQYKAVTEGCPATADGLLVSHLDENHPGKVFSAPASDKTREAKTHYRVLKRGAKYTLIELALETGRRHQIRVQLADIRCPIVGDEKYGSRTDPAKRLGLHSCLLRFAHPVTKKEMQFESPLPAALAHLL